MYATAESLRRCDPDRYFCTLFAPAIRRDALFTLYAFNHEIARAQEVTSEPTLAQIRLQWWREVVQGAERRHGMASPLQALIAAGVVAREDALALIEARDDAISAPPQTVTAFMSAMLAGPGGLAATAGAVLGADAEEQDALRRIGAAYGVAGTLRNLPYLAGHGRCDLPDEVLAAGRLTRAQAVENPASALAACGPVLRGAALMAAAAPRQWRRPILAAALPGVFARRDLARKVPPTSRGTGDRVAVLLAVIRGVV